MMKIKTWSERCEDHPDHQSGMVTNQMIQSRMQEEIDELRAQPKYKRVDLETFYKNTCNCEGDGGPCMSCAHDFGWNECIDDIKEKYGDLYAEEK